MRLPKNNLAAIILLMSVCAAGCSATSTEDEDARYFYIQSEVIQASIAREFETLEKRVGGLHYPEYLRRAFYLSREMRKSPFDNPFVKSYRYFREYLSSEHGVILVETKSGYEVYDETTEKHLDVFERKDWQTIRALARDCNTSLEEKGRLACEFDGGYDDAETPFTTFLFNVAYLEYQSQWLGYEDGRYELVEEGASAVPFDMYDLLKRNGIIRMFHYRLLANTAALLREKEGDTRGPFTVYDVGYEDWHAFLKNGLKIDGKWTATGIKLTDLRTNEKVFFPRDEDLVQEALRELNYCREKVNFSEHFMVGNYPVFLLSILRLYDVNLQIDEASGKVIIVPGPTDHEAFFDIVAECTFVNDPSDTEYLKEHLTSWLEADPH